MYAIRDETAATTTRPMMMRMTGMTPSDMEVLSFESTMSNAFDVTRRSLVGPWGNPHAWSVVTKVTLTACLIPVPGENEG